MIPLDANDTLKIGVLQGCTEFERKLMAEMLILLKQAVLKLRNQF